MLHADATVAEAVECEVFQLIRESKERSVALCALNVCVLVCVCVCVRRRSR